MNIHVVAYDYQLSEHSATWDAAVYRDDWTAVGVNPLVVTNSIWVHNGKIASFTSVPRDPADVEQLGTPVASWRCARPRRYLIETPRLVGRRI
jgi:hypothetical protein